MAVYNGIDGIVLAVKQEFLDDQDVPLIPKSGYPVVKLMDMDKAVIASVTCSPGLQPGLWTANISVPSIGLEERTEFTLVWRLVTPAGDKYRYTDSVFLDPKVDTRETDVVALFGDMRFQFVLPAVFNGPADTGVFQIYFNNQAIVDPVTGSLNAPTTTITNHLDKTTFSVPLIV